MKSTRDEFGNACGIVDLAHPFRGRAEEGLEIHLLKRAPLAHGTFDLPNEQDQRRRIVFRDVDRMRGIGRAGPARDEGDAGASCEARGGFGGERGARFLPANGDLDG